MLINIENERAKRESQAYIHRFMIKFEDLFVKSVLIALRSQFHEIAGQVAKDNYDIEFILSNNEKMQKAFEINYKRIYIFFGKLLFENIEEIQKSFGFYSTKTFLDEYFSSMFSWARFQMGMKIKNINNTTRNIITRIIRKGREEGDSSAQIAKSIREKSKITNRARANNIARTEAHTVAQKSLKQAMNTTRIKYEKEWLTAGDSRVRSGNKGFNHVNADGERVPQDEYFERTGEPLEYPGDPAGSAGNVCRCRCTTLYHTVAVSIFRSARAA